MDGGCGIIAWALVDDRPGNKSQCLGVALTLAGALGIPFQTRELAYWPLASLPNFVLGPSFMGLAPSSRPLLAPPWPDLVIAAGRRLAPVALKIKRLSGGKAFLAQIMHPGFAFANNFDLIAVPIHDRPGKRQNQITITGAPHRVTGDALAKAALEWRPLFASLPRPWIALLVGGSTRRRAFTKEMAQSLGKAASRLGGSLLASTSRRSAYVADALIAEITCPRHVYKWGDNGANPYLGYLALADAIVVTGDSVSMCSEACGGSVPVYIHAPPGLISAKHARFHRALYEGGYARPFEGNLENWTHPPLNAANQVAAEIKRRLNL